MLERNTREVGEIGRQIHAFRTSPSLWQQHTANDPIPSERHTSQQVEEAVDPYTASLTARERKLYALLKA